MNGSTSQHSRWEPVDLVQHQIVSAVAARQQGVPRVMFKGGTLLRVCYRRDWRFSEDLDFDWIHADDTKPAIQDFFDRVLNTASRTHRTVFDTKWGANKLNIYWELPNATTGVIFTDVKPRQHPGAGPTAAHWTILDRYPQVDTTNPILGYSPASMLAAKLDCIANPYRLAPRDYYDLNRLLQDPSIDTNAALDEFTARHQAAHPATAGRDWFDILFDNAYQHEAELGGFDASVLVLWRARLRASARPERIFDAVREAAAVCGALAKRTRRALDSTVLYDAVAAQDTVTMIASQIRRVRRLAPRAAAAALLHDYDGRAKPSCGWRDPEERAWLIDDLVTDAGDVLDALEGAELTAEQADAAELLAAVAGQDVEADPKAPGRRRIARRVAPGRIISTADPEARHARKTRSQRRDGYKAHIVAEPDTGIITAAELTTADTSDARVGPRLLQADPTAPHNTDTGTADTGTGAGGALAEGFAGLVPADSAYASGEALEEFASAGYATAIKPIDPKPHIAGGYTREDFAIDADAQTVTCPAGHTRAVKSGAARFGKLCRGCPQRARCTTSATGRSVTVDAHHRNRQANKDRWADPATRAAYRRHRPMAERSIAWLTRNKARRVPCRGVAANHLWLTHRAAAVNLVRLTNLGITCTNGALTI